MINVLDCICLLKISKLVHPSHCRLNESRYLKCFTRFQLVLYTEYLHFDLPCLISSKVDMKKRPVKFPSFFQVAAVLDCLLSQVEKEAFWTHIKSNIWEHLSAEVSTGRLPCDGTETGRLETDPTFTWLHHLCTCFSPSVCPTFLLLSADRFPISGLASLHPPNFGSSGILCATALFAIWLYTVMHR